jgi:hypothetical protein
VIGSSLWSANPDKLREIDARHGILPDDPHVYSVAAYLADRRAIEAEWDALSRANNWQKLESGSPKFREFWAAQSRFIARLDNCRARHFPGLNDLNLDTVDRLR